MAEEIPSQGDLYELFQNEVQSRAPKLTDFEEGSNLDALGGGFSVGGQEIVKFVIDSFAKTFFNTSNGSKITGNTDDLQALAKDHFGDNFARPGAAKATATMLFSRLSAVPGNVVIPVDTIVKTEKDADGNELRYRTVLATTMVGLSVNVSVEAIEGGSDSNAQADTIINIETALTDPEVVVTNPLGAVGGAPEQEDPEYREFIRRQVDTIRGATGAAIQAAAENVPGVEIATIIESIINVIEFDIGTNLPVVGAEYFQLPRGILYIADANGTASDALIASVLEAITAVRACGVVKQVKGATPLPMDWSASYTLNPGGPNFAEFNSDPSQVVETMEQYIRDIPIGTGFDRGLAKLAIMAIWGPSGTTDLTDFVTSTPSGSISATAVDKLIPGTVEII